jgi:hypothetical protein
MLKELLPKDIDRNKVDIWSQDETRVGQQGSLTLVYGLSVALDPEKCGSSNSFRHISTVLLVTVQVSLSH